jgi:hypothetical protein
MAIHRTFPYRGQAMKYESATIKELLEIGVPILNTSAPDLEPRLALHMDAIVRHRVAHLPAPDT